MLMTREAPTFVQVTEIWVPDGDVLIHAGGNYAGKDGFAESSVRTSFAKGEGLPGKAWAEGRPVVLKGFDGSYFLRAEAAAEAGLTAAVAIPVFDGDTLKAVLVVLCSEDAEHMGAIEVWEDKGGVLVLNDGFYGAAQEFEFVSQHTTFSYGQGLPGGVWAAGVPILMRDLGKGYAFLRADAAGRAGLSTGIGIPLPSPTDSTYVLTLISAEGTPIARRFEIWDARATTVGPAKEALLVDGLCEVEGPLWSGRNPDFDAPRAAAWRGPVGQVLGTGLPFISTGPGLPAGYGSMVALPVYHGGELAHVVAWYL